MNWAIPLTDLVLTEADIEAWLDTLRAGWLTMGPRTIEFETRFAELLGVPHAVAVSSGTAALHLAMLGAGVGPGDEVVVPDLTFVAAAATVRACGAEPVFADALGVKDHGLDPVDVAMRLTPRTRAVLATHWWGYACDAAAIAEVCAERGIALIEDCAESICARVADGRLTGTIGAAGCFSFFSKKQLAVGEGGMVITADGDLAARVRSLRSHTMTSVTWDRHRGHAESYDVTGVGFNYRIDEPRAALALSRLPRLAADIEVRRELVRRYRRLLADVPGVLVPWDEDAVERGSHFAFGVLLDSSAERDRVAVALRADGIQTSCYPTITSLSAYRQCASRPRAAEIAARQLVLPLASTFTAAEVDAVVASLESALATPTPA